MIPDGRQTDRSALRYVVVGCGRVGVTWARYLAAVGGEPAGFASRRRRSAQAAVKAAGSGKLLEIPGNVWPKADLVLITTPDSQIKTVGRQLGVN